LAEFSQNSTSLWRTELSGAQAGPATNSSLSWKGEGVVAKNHRTVWCAPDCPVSQRRPWPTVGSAISGRRLARANGRLVTPDCVRCAKGTEGATVGFARKGRGSSIRQVLFMSGGAPDCPVRHPTEGKNCLPIGTSTAPSCLGAIKGTP
jgi:hypothetical protein